ncbi:hypothetical protein CRG98_021512 [Punica granatum]|uniref:Uncharacterized protein n=1 Tax=Punica granatum TaxID=22663 RepID=A0A2I0JP53_PUNGR|nr:hypothetical protein CRG98_021512 [Punica granatum]
MDSETQSDSCSMVRVTLECVQACFRVPFICSWIGPPKGPVRKSVCECSRVSRIKQETSKMCSEACVFISVGPIVNSDPSFSRASSIGASGPKWGANSFHGLRPRIYCFFTSFSLAFTAFTSFGLTLITSRVSTSHLLLSRCTNRICSRRDPHARAYTHVLGMFTFSEMRDEHA